MNPDTVESRRLNRRTLAAVAITALVVAGALVMWRLSATPPLNAAEREARATELMSGMRISADVTDSTLAASKALVDYLSEPAGRLVLVRIVDEVDLEVRIETEQDVIFNEPPSFCLIGPFSAPDDGGYSSPCWGTPDIGEVLAAQLPTDDAGHAMVRAGEPIVLSATIGRGGLRCDYPPGAWLLGFKADLLVDGMPTIGRELPEISFEIPWEGTGPLPFLPVRTVAYCGSANIVYREQGEPELASPSP